MSFNHHGMSETGFDFDFGDPSLPEPRFESPCPSHIQFGESPTASGPEPPSTSNAFEATLSPHSHGTLDSTCDVSADVQWLEEGYGVKCLPTTVSTQLYTFEEKGTGGPVAHGTSMSNSPPNLLHTLQTLDPAWLQTPNGADILGYPSSHIYSPFPGDGFWKDPGAHLPSEPETFTSADHIEVEPNALAVDNPPVEKGKSRFFSKSARNTLKSWFVEHQKYPYPTNEEGSALATRTGLTLRQVRTFLGNMRVRMMEAGSCTLFHLS